MKKTFGISDGIASVLNSYEIKGLLNLLIMISDSGRFDKHEMGIGKTIRRRDTNKERFYGKCKSLVKIIGNSKNIREFDKFIDADSYLKKQAISLISEILDFIKNETIKHPVVLDEIERKIFKLSKSIMEVK